MRNAFEAYPSALGSPFREDFTRSLGARASLHGRAAADFEAAEEGELAGAAMHHELLSKVPNDYLLNEDRVSMYHGLEVRVPLLRPRLIELARQVPMAMHFERDASLSGKGTQDQRLAR